MVGFKSKKLTRWSFVTHITWMKCYHPSVWYRNSVRFWWHSLTAYIYIYIYLILQEKNKSKLLDDIVTHWASVSTWIGQICKAFHALQQQIKFVDFQMHCSAEALVRPCNCSSKFFDFQMHCSTYAQHDSLQNQCRPSGTLVLATTVFRTESSSRQWFQATTPNLCIIPLPLDPSDTKHTKKTCTQSAKNPVRRERTTEDIRGNSTHSHTAVCGVQGLVIQKYSEKHGVRLRIRTKLKIFFSAMVLALHIKVGARWSPF
jgi:hypothetical protein